MKSIAIAAIVAALLSNSFPHRADYTAVFMPGQGNVDYQNKGKGSGNVKGSVTSSLSLGDFGYAVVGYTQGTKNEHAVNCFKSTGGIDFIVHEGQSGNIVAEEIDVYVTPDRNPNTQNWHMPG